MVDSEPLPPFGKGSESTNSTALASARVFPSSHAAPRLPGDCPEPHTEHRRQKGQKGATVTPNTQGYALEFPPDCLFKLGGGMLPAHKLLLFLFITSINIYFAAYFYILAFYVRMFKYKSFFPAEWYSGMFLTCKKASKKRLNIKK